MAPPPPNEGQRKDEEKNDVPTPSFSSWVGSLFERDVRNEIHDQLNDFGERKKQYEEEQKERKRLLEQHASSSSFPFPFFVPPGNGDRRDKHPFFFPPDSKQHNDDVEDAVGGFPRWQGGFDGHEEENGNRRWSPFENERDRRGEQQNIDDFQKEMQNFFDAAFTGGMMPPGGRQLGGNGGWTSSSSSTTVVSNSNGADYTMKQDSKNGARVDLKLPKNCRSENLSLEVLRDRPCMIRWRNKDEGVGDAANGVHNHTFRHRPSKAKKQEQTLELGDSVDCSRLSASLSEAQRTLTVEAPPRGRSGEEDRTSLSRSQSNDFPRLVNIEKK